MSDPKLFYRIAAFTDKGLEREHNEDYHLFTNDITSGKWGFFEDVSVDEPDPSGSVLIVADGMGGLNAGEIASNVSCDAVSKYFSENFNKEILDDDHKIKEFLFSAIDDAQDVLVKYQKTNPDTVGMGTTMVIAWVIKNKAHVAWVGDSRCYLYTNDDGLKVMSKDHSYVQTLVDDGKISKEQAFFHPDSNIITQSMGSADRPPKPDYILFSVNTGDRLLLCSDGLNGMLEDFRIKQILDENTDSKECTDILIDEAKKAGGHDNITVILCDFAGAGYSGKRILLADKSTPKLKKKSIYTLIVFLLIAVCLVGAGYKFYYLPKKVAKAKIESKKDSISKAKAKKDSLEFAKKKTEDTLNKDKQNQNLVPEKKKGEKKEYKKGEKEEEKKDEKKDEKKITPQTIPEIEKAKDTAKKK